LTDREAFLEQIRNDPVFAQHFFRGLSEGLVGRAYSELRRQRVGVRTEAAFHLFSYQIADAIKRPPETIMASQSIQAAAQKMAELDIGSLLVGNSTKDIVGIVTDTDLRTKVVAQGLDLRWPVEKIMTSPVLTISADEPCFEALLQMMNHKVHYLAVTRDAEMVGVVTAHDITIFHGHSPIDLLREIVAQRKIEGLYALSARVPHVVRRLIEEGAKANNITRVITILNDHILERLLSLMQEEMGSPPVRFCWITMGSEGRKEQTFRTDQDNAILYENPPGDWETVKATKLYFRHFGNQAINHLVACGYPLCKGKMMASNTKWRKPYTVWQGYFEDWMGNTDSENTLYAKIFFDFRPTYGAVEIGARLREYVGQKALKTKPFLRHLARDCIQLQTPLTFFRNFIVEKDGEHKNSLDLKLRGLVPLVDFARMMALKHGIDETNTASRLRSLFENGVIPEDIYKEAIEAYEFLMQLRLAHQLEMMEAGQTPHNYVDPSELSDLERMTLKAAFDVVNRIQTYVARLGFME
jgi:CBS domain-containing protein